jgi:hypothetical protein
MSFFVGVDSLLASEWTRLEEIQALLEPFAAQTNLLQSDCQSLSGTVPSMLNLEGHLHLTPQEYPSTKKPADILLTEFRKRFQLIADVNVDKFNPIPSAACLLDPAFARVLLIPEQAPLLHAAKKMVISLCSDSSGETATDEPAILTGSKNTAALAKKFTFLASKLHIASSSGTLSNANNQETAQGQLNRYLSELIEADMDIENGIDF